MLMPKKTKFRKKMKGNMKGTETRGCALELGQYGLQALEPAWITSRQIEAARRAITRHMRRMGKLWIRIFPDKPVTKKPIGVRMGGGKGNPEFWVAVVLPGKVLFEIGGVPEAIARECLRLADTKLGIRTQLVSREQ